MVDSVNSIKQILIRADAGGELGTGHVMRMIALAQAYVRRGGYVMIASVQCPEPIIDRVLALGIGHHMLNSCELGDAQDSAATLQLCKDYEGEWLVLDGYHFDEDYQQKVAGHDIKVLCVDDYGHCNTWNCDAVLNQNLGAEHWVPRNSKRVDTKWLLGSSFALIREEFFGSIRQAKEKKVPADRILVTMGGADPDNVTLKVLCAMEETSLDGLKIRVLVGGANPHQEKLTQFADSSRYQIEVLCNVNEMSPMYEWADAVISAGGSTCWEWLAYGLPGAVVTIAENQEPIVKELNDKQLALSLGWFNEGGSCEWALKLNEWLNNLHEFADYSSRRHVVDCKGAARVAALLHGKLTITVATSEHGWLRGSVDSLCEKLRKEGHLVLLVYKAEDIHPSDVLFLLSFWNLISSDILNQNIHNLVVHESDLPNGKGWSPLTWQVIDGKNEIPIVLFEAVEKIDAGPIYLRSDIRLDEGDLIDEIHEKQAEKTYDLCEAFIDSYPQLIGEGEIQKGEETFYSRRTPDDSEIDPEKSIASQFDLLRTVDNMLYPAFFHYRNHKYVIRLEKGRADG
jgi:UDP-2,4-diacetamido-2,4,6-trideoxy-beta-L-altropyranose hydrolase